MGFYLDDENGQPMQAASQLPAPIATPTPVPVSGGGGGYYLDDEAGNPIPQPTQGPGFWHEAKALGGRAIKGTGDLVGSIADLADLAAGGFGGFSRSRIMSNALGLSNEPTYGQQISQFTEEYNPLKQYQPSSEILGTAAEWAPTALIPGGGGILSRLAMALAGGGTTGAIKEAGGGEGAQMVGGLVGSMGPSAVKGTVGLTQKASRKATTALADLYDVLIRGGEKGAEAKAGKLLQEVLSDVEVQKLKGYAPGQYPRTTAEVTGSQNLAALQKTAEKMPEINAPLQQIQAEREALRVAELKKLDPEALGKMTSQERGHVVRNILSRFYKQAKGTAEELYENAPQDVPLNVRHIGEKAQALLNKVYGKSDLAPPKKLMQDLEPFILRSRGREYLSGDLYVKAKDLGKRISIYAKKDPEAVMIAKTVRDDILAELDNLPGWGEARSFYKEMQDTYKAGASGAALAKGAFGRPAQAESRILSSIMTSPEAADEFIAAAKGSPELLRQYRGFVIDEISLARKSPDAWPEFVRKRLPQIEKIMKAENPEHWRSFKKVIGDIRSELRVGEAAAKASKGQSATSQFQVASKFLDKETETAFLKVASKLGTATGFIGGGVSQGVVGAIAGLTAGRVVQTQAEKAMQLRKLVIAAALADPAFAKKLVTATTPQAKQVLKADFGRALKRAMAMSAFKAEGEDGSDLQQPDQQRPAIAPSMTPEGGIDDKLVRSIIQVESAGDPRAVSPAGAKGLMQLMPAMARKMGVTDPFDPEQNVAGGTRLLNEELERFGDLELALAAYNAGSPKVSAAIKKAGSKDFAQVAQYLPRETRDYVPKVLKLYEQG